VDTNFIPTSPIPLYVRNNRGRGSFLGIELGENSMTAQSPSSRRHYRRRTAMARRHVVVIGGRAIR